MRKRITLYLLTLALLVATWSLAAPSIPVHAAGQAIVQSAAGSLPFEFAAAATPGKTPGFTEAPYIDSEGWIHLKSLTDQFIWLEDGPSFADGEFEFEWKLSSRSSNISFTVLSRFSGLQPGATGHPVFAGAQYINSGDWMTQYWLGSGELYSPIGKPVLNGTANTAAIPMAAPEVHLVRVVYAGTTMTVTIDGIEQGSLPVRSDLPVSSGKLGFRNHNGNVQDFMLRNIRMRASGQTEWQYYGENSAMPDPVPLSIITNTAEVRSGQSISFAASTKSVSWTVEGGGAETFINESGQLTVGANELSGTELTVKASLWSHPQVIAAKTVQVVEDNDAVVFGVLSDIHVGTSDSSSAAYPNNQRFAAVLDWYGRQGVDAVALSGDLSDFGRTNDWNQFQAVVQNRLDSPHDSAPDKPVMVAAMGNHDAYGGGTAAFVQATGQKTNADYVVGGYHFITVNPGAVVSGENTGSTSRGFNTAGSSSNWDNSFAQATKNWLRARIDLAKAEDPAKPIFILCHWPIQNTFYVSDEWYTSSFGTSDTNYFFKNDPQVVVFSGHIHSPNQDPRSIWQSGFTSVNTGSMHYMEMEGSGSAGQSYLGYKQDGISTNSHPRNPVNPASESSVPMMQGMIVEVEGSEVTIKNYDFDATAGPSGQAELEQVWTFDVSQPANFPYTNTRREAAKTAPLFDDSKPAGTALTGEIDVQSRPNDQTKIDVTFKQAAMPAGNPSNAGKEAVHSYKFEIRNIQTGALVKTAWQWSDFMWPTRLRQEYYTQTLGGLQPNVEYELRIYAFGSFQQQSSQYLHDTFIIGGTQVSLPDYNLSFNNTLDNGTGKPAAVQVLSTSNPASLTSGTVTMPEYADAGASGQKALHLAASGAAPKSSTYIDMGNTFNYNQSFTFAFDICVNDGYSNDAAIFSNKDWTSGSNAGFIVSAHSSGGIRLNYNVGGGSRSDITLGNKSTTIGQWVHVAAVFRKETNTVDVYLNGTKVNSNTGVNLSNGISGGVNTYIGQTVEPSGQFGNAGKYSIDFKIADFVLQPGAMSEAMVLNLAQS